MAMGMLVVPTETVVLNFVHRVREQKSDPHADRHRQEDPQGQEAVEERKSFWSVLLLAMLFFHQRGGQEGGDFGLARNAAGRQPAFR